MLHLVLHVAVPVGAKLLSRIAGLFFDTAHESEKFNCTWLIWRSSYVNRTMKTVKPPVWF